MKFRVHEVFLGVFLTVAVFAVGMIFESSRTPSASDKPQQSTDYRSTPVIPEHTADKATDWLLVVLNLFLVVSTLLLWKANNRSAKIAERALTELESPFIGVQIIESGVVVHWTSKENCHIEKSWNGLRFAFVNHGRTAAVLLELEDKLQICEEGATPTLEWPAERKKPYPYGVLIGSDKTSAESFRLFEDFTNEDEFLTFTYGDGNLFLVGKLKYRDIFTGIFEMGFCMVFNRETGRFMMEGDDAYNYCRKIS